ncbi:hypothetical protein DPMN_104295 [Dreissena polymorpha]|uniref:Uncharacterized protein n=1 Tax=Dreissena polymorpha TaxID=45954 RepID=A0A9D4JZX4_DREPO|nr:hypothetical protein DPMN_104295 [Dreissena polymorpha]
MKRVMENDRVGHLIDLIQAQDLDRDELFYSIVGEWNVFLEKAYVVYCKTIIE